MMRVSRDSGAVDVNVTTRVTTYNGDHSIVLGVTATTVSANGLSKTTQVDMNGDGTFDRTTSDSTSTNQNGGQTENVTVTSADGTLLSQVITSRSTDGVSRDTVTLDPAGHILASDTIGVGPQGGTREDACTAGANGTTILGETVKFTSADGVTTTTQMDHAGDGTFDRVVTDQTIKQSDGSATEIVGTRASGGALSVAGADCRPLRRAGRGGAGRAGTIGVRPWPAGSASGARSRDEEERRLAWAFDFRSLSHEIGGVGGPAATLEVERAEINSGISSAPRLKNLERKFSKNDFPNNF